MELRELRLDRLPGLPAPFTITGRPGLNLILGPNGSGKTSLVRAALGLLWPDDASSGHVTGVWHGEGAMWHASRIGSAPAVWQRDGQPHEPPPLPRGDHAASFRLGLLDVLKISADTSDASLARAIRRQMAGGYDLAAMLAGVTVSGREGQTEASQLRVAEQRVADLQAKQRELQRDEARLANLEQEARVAQEEARRAEALKLAAATVAAKAAAESANAQLEATYPAVMDRVREDDAQVLARLRDRQRSLDAESAAIRRDADHAGAQLAVAGFAGAAPAAETIETARKRIDAAHRIATELDRIRSDLAAAEAALAAARRHLSPWGEPAGDQAVDREALRQEARAVQALGEATAEREGFDRLLALPALQPADEPNVTPQAAASAWHALLAWLAAAGERRWPWAALLAALALVGVGALPQPWSSDAPLMGWVAIAVGVAALTAALLPRALSARSRRAREDYHATGLPAPPTWTDAEVRKLALELADQEAALRLDQLRQRLREDLIAHRDRADRLAGAAGAAGAVDRLETAEWLHRNAAWHEALSVRTAAAARCDHLAAELAQTITAARRDLSAWLVVSADGSADLAALDVAVDALRRRRAQHDEATAAIAAAERRLADLDRQAHETDGEIAALLRRLDLDPHPDNDAVVRDLAVRLARYRQEKAAAASLDVEAKQRLRDIGALSAPWLDLVREALGWTAEHIAAALAAATAEASQYEAAHEEVIAIRTRRDLALRDDALDAALAARDRARDALAAVRDEVRAKALRQLLLQRLQQQHRQRSEPPVLRRARALFQRFTTGRYDLLVAEADSESFRARDTATGQGLALTPLSDGTRAQLLLAARLAYLHEVERGAKVPLFFDESLTASDPERFAAIGGALLDQIADEGRQMFYLTCDPADVEAWQQLLAARGGEPAPVIDLARVRGLAAAAPIARLRPPAAAAVPAPLPDEPAADYAARLGDVPPLDVHAPPAAAHLFHLLRDDLALLHRLLAQRVATVGQVESLAATLAAAGALAPAQLERLRARQLVLAAFLAAASIGRGRPVPPGSITAHSGSTSALLPEIERLLLSPAICGDARRLLDALARGEVPRLWQKVQTDLADWLADAGYLDTRPPLGAGELRAQALQAAAAEIGAGRLDFAAIDSLVAGWTGQLDGG